MYSIEMLYRIRYTFSVNLMLRPDTVESSPIPCLLVPSGFGRLLYYRVYSRLILYCKAKLFRGIAERRTAERRTSPQPTTTTTLSYSCSSGRTIPSVNNNYKIVNNGTFIHGGGSHRNS